MSDLFPVCTLHGMPQRSDEWFAIRQGLLTASVAGSWLAEEPKVKETIPQLKEILDKKGVEYPNSAKHGALVKLASSEALTFTLTAKAEDAREKVINRLIAERMGYVKEDAFELDMEGPPPKSPALRAIYYGIFYEGDALATLSFDKELDLEEVGFCEHESGVAGCSPDSLIKGKSVIAENKVTMEADIQIGRLRANVLPDCFRDQVHFQMSSTGAESCWFQSWHPKLPPLQILVPRDDYTERMADGIDRFKVAFEEAAKPFKDQFTK